MKVLRKIVEIDEERCDGCGVCVPACAEGAITIEDGKARLVAERYCDGLGACLGECPKDAIRIVEREAEDFDEEAVEAYLKAQEAPAAELPRAGGCPSQQVQCFSAAEAFSGGGAAAEPGRGGDSALGHWPVQIHLVPPTAPFLKDADLLVTADCVPVACGVFHRDFLPGKVVLMGCPKFDDVPAYLQKFKEIFGRGDIRSVTVLSMEVPCCSALPSIVKSALAASDRDIPLEEVVIARRGAVLDRVRTAA